MGEWQAQTPMSRSKRRAMNNEGVVFGGGTKNDSKKEGLWRKDDLELFDKYLESRQYDGMQPWDQKEDSGGDYIPVRKRAPRIIYNFAKVLTDRIASKLFGGDVFPNIKVEDDPDTDDFLGFVEKAAKLRVHLLDVAKKALGAGAGFLRFYFVQGHIQIETFKSKYCYPEFGADGELESIRIQYIYEDFEDLDKDGNPKWKWYKLQLGNTRDILFNNPDYDEGEEPNFSVVNSVDHNLGYVQGQWFKAPGGDHNSPDGNSVLCDLLDFIDEINYSVSQSSETVQYNQDPLLSIKGLSEEETNLVVRSSRKALNLGREGEANFVESTGEGVKTAIEHRDKIRLMVQDVARVVFLDPEKMASHAQSGRAMEVMHGPLVELINELRPHFEPQVVALLLKLAVTFLTLNDQGVETDVMIPPGWQPKSMNVSAHWPPIFPLTIDDLKSMAAIGVQVATANIFSRETITRWLAPHFHVDDIDEELDKIASQPIMNPFGGGFMDDNGGGNKPPPKPEAK